MWWTVDLCRFCADQSLIDPLSRTELSLGKIGQARQSSTYSRFLTLWRPFTPTPFKKLSQPSYLIITVLFWISVLLREDPSPSVLKRVGSKRSSWIWSLPLGPPFRVFPAQLMVCLINLDCFDLSVVAGIGFSEVKPRKKKSLFWFLRDIDALRKTQKNWVVFLYLMEALCTRKMVKGRRYQL